MDKTYCITLDSNDLGQLLEGLESRAESWEKTAHYLLNGDSGNSGLFLAEECHKPEEAHDIAGHYRSIIQQIRDQMAAQS